MVNRRRILVVDDEVSQRELLGGFLESLGIHVEQAGSAEDALESIRGSVPEMVLLDVRLPGMSGIDALPEIRKISADLPVLLITAYADLRQAVAAMKIGADDYLAKPLDLDELETVIFDSIGRPEEELQAGARVLPELPADFVCQSPAMRRVVETVAVVAPSDVPVLVMGASGVGKEVVAQLIHQWSPRSDGPLVVCPL